MPEISFLRIISHGFPSFFDGKPLKALNSQLVFRFIRRPSLQSYKKKSDKVYIPNRLPKRSKLWIFVKFMSQKRPQKIHQIERKDRDKKVFWVLQRCCFCVFGCQSIAFACSKQPFYVVKAMLWAGKRAAFGWYFGVF